MGALEVITWIINLANKALDFVFFWGGLIIILGYPVYFFTKNIKKYNKEKQSKTGDLLSQTLILVFVSIVIGLFWALPELIILLFPKLAWFPTVSRWIYLAIILTVIIYMFGHEYGGKRWLHSCIGHIAVIFFGLIVGRWIGILFISLPLFVAYYSILYRLALIILPTSDPEDRAERWKRFIVLASYTWGIQFPLMVVGEHAWKKIETRIAGDFARNILPVPGFVWTRSHQVVSITGGTKFKRVDGPGVVFTGYLERAEQVFDLRLQLRTNEIDVVSKDGISFKVRVFTAFRMDPEIWDKETYDRLRPMNTILRGANKPSYMKGSFSYSNLRVQAALGITSTKVAEGSPTIYWDQWALSVVEDQARKVISQKNLDELWRPAEDKKFANALEKIANEIKENTNPIFRAKGILLIVSRIVNFRFPSDNDQLDEISKQQLATWGSEWERKRVNMLSEAQAESEHTQQEARAYAESLLLNSIADGLQKAKEIDPNLPRYVIAMRFLSSLQDYVHKQTDEKSMEELQNNLKEWQEQFLTDHGKGK